MEGVNPKVVIAADNTSLLMGGEAALPYHLFRVLLALDVDVRLVTHERNRPELDADFAGHADRIHYLPETRPLRALWRVAEALPAHLGEFVFGMPARLLVQRRMRRVIRGLVADGRCDVVHQPTPVAPREPSLLFDLGAPVVIGPMNGNVEPPPAFSHVHGRVSGAVVRLGRRGSWLLNRVIRGKQEAAIVLVANERTRAALPDRLAGEVVEMVENGVELGLWSGDGITAVEPSTPSGDLARFVFVGRLVTFKAVDVLLDAVAEVVRQRPVRLDVVGDGDQRARLEDDIDRLGLRDTVVMHGWLSQSQAAALLRTARAMVMPSVAEPGGAVVLEAMAASRPVISTNWGGMAGYLDERCAILVDPTSREALVTGFAEAMVALVDDPARADALGRAGRALVEERYDWMAKGRRYVELYRRAADSST